MPTGKGFVTASTRRSRSVLPEIAQCLSARVRRAVLCSVLFFCALASIGYAEDSIFSDPVDGQFDASRYLAENAFGFLPVPIIITEPAVDNGLGAVGLFFHETDEQQALRRERLQADDSGTASLLTPSASALAAAYTGNGSYFVGGGHMGFWRQGRIRYLGGGGYGDVNLDFYGSGNVNLNKPLELNTKALGIVQSLKFRMGDWPLYVGVGQRYIDASIEPVSLGDLGGDLLPPELQERWEEIIRSLLSVDVTTSGLGLVVEFDTRDNFFSPRKGFRYELDHLWYRDGLGSDIDYELTEFTGLNYLPINEQWRTALRVNTQYANADGLLPQFATPAMVLRGIPAARYQGNAIGVLEAEVTRQLNPRWSVNAFMGAGRAANAFGDLSDAKSRVTHGGGFRYLVARRYGLEMGVDVARGPEDTILYIQAGTAW